MKATIRGVEVEGSVEEIQKLLNLTPKQPMTPTIRTTKPTRTKRRKYTSKYSGHKATCPQCGRIFRLTYSQLAKKDGTPNYCGKSCAAKVRTSKLSLKEKRERMAHARKFRCANKAQTEMNYNN